MRAEFFVSPSPYFVTAFERRSNPLLVDIEPDVPASTRPMPERSRAGSLRRLGNLFQLQPVPRSEA